MRKTLRLRKVPKCHRKPTGGRNNGEHDAHGVDFDITQNSNDSGSGARVVKKMSNLFLGKLDNRGGGVFPRGRG